MFIGNILRGDFGRSIHFREPAWRVVMGYLPASVQLALTAFGHQDLPFERLVG